MSTLTTDKTNKTLVTVILDRSGSMASTIQQTIDGYNEYINGLKSDKETEYTISLIQFDAPAANPELTVSYQDRALADVPALSKETYDPRGNTPLYDAIGECVRRVDAKDRGVIVMVITDGMENASREFTKDAIKKLIAEKESIGWTFAFLGADIDSYAVGGSLGINVNNTAQYVKGHEHAMYSTMAQATMLRSASNRMIGVMASASMPLMSASMKSAIEQPKHPGSKPTIKPPTGGRPAAPKPFRRDWRVTNA